MVSRNEKDADLFFDYQVDAKGCIKSMFWCDCQARQDYQDYVDVVVFDNTYKLNRFYMSFIPLVGLDCTMYLREMLYHTSPKLPIFG